MRSVTRSVVVLAFALLAVCTPAMAQIDVAAVPMEVNPFGRNSTAFGNGVYLIVDRGTPINARILDKNGNKIAGPFAISGGNEGFTGWPVVTFGGPSNDPVFLVSYIATTDAKFHAKYGRFVRYQSGGVTVGGRFLIADTGVGNDSWHAGEKAQAVWNGSHFIVGSRTADSPVPQIHVAHLTLAGTVTARQVLGDYADYYGQPALACAADGVCLVTGFAQRGWDGGSYGRFFHASTLQPIGNMFYVTTVEERQGRMEDQAVVYDLNAGRFLVAWWRAGFGETRLFQTNGSRGVVQTVTPGDAGELALAYNHGTKTSLLVTKGWGSNLFALELGSGGTPVNAANTVMITETDFFVFGTPEYVPAIGVNGVDGHWLVTAVQWGTGRAALVRRGGAPPPGESTPPPGEPMPPPPPPPPDPFTAWERRRADFNGDALSDLLWQNTSNGQLAVWLLDGARLKIEAGLSHNMPDTNWRVVGTGDFNGDGKPDILWHHRLQGYVAVWFMNGRTVAGVASLSTPQVSDIAWQIAGVGDFNHDGQPDIVWQHTTGPLALWAMNGINVAYAVPVFGEISMVTPAWRVAAVADMNGDGHVDLLWRHNSGWVATWLMNGVNITGVRSLNPVAEFDTAWRIVGTADINRDGRYDILWQHTDGTVAAWTMDGLARVQTLGVGYGSLTGSNWKVVGPK